MLDESNHGPEQDEATIPATDSQSDLLSSSSHHSSSQPISQHEVIGFHQRMAKSSRQSSMRNLEVETEDKVVTKPKKVLKFATNPENDQVWVMIHTFDKIPTDLKSQLWWKKGELEKCYDTELELLHNFEQIYKQTLRMAYLSCKGKTSGGIALCLNSMMRCADVRGLEREVAPQLKHYIKKHRNGVIMAEAEASRKEKSQDEEDFDKTEFIRQQSKQFSRTSLLLSIKMGEFDNISAYPEGKRIPPPLMKEGSNRRAQLQRQDSSDALAPEDRRQYLRRENSFKNLADKINSHEPRRRLLKSDTNNSASEDGCTENKASGRTGGRENRRKLSTRARANSKGLDLADGSLEPDINRRASVRGGRRQARRASGESSSGLDLDSEVKPQRTTTPGGDEATPVPQPLNLRPRQSSNEDEQITADNPTLLQSKDSSRRISEV